MKPYEASMIDPAGGRAPEKKNVLQRLTGIFLEPEETLLEIAGRPSWLFPLLLSLALMLIPFLLQPVRVPLEMRIKATAEQAARFTGQEAKEIEKALSAREETVWTKYQSVIGILIVTIPATLAIAGILLGAFLVAGCPLSYKNSLAAYCWSGLPPSAAMAGFAVLFLYLKDPVDLNPLDPLGNIISHLGMLTDSKTHPALYSLLNSLDLFSFWRIFLLGLGFSTATFEKTDLKKSITIILILWALYVSIKTGIAAVWS